MTKPHTSSPKSTILPFQKPVFDRLCAVARACLYVDRTQFSALKLRACFLLIGPTGSGKTFLARALAQEMRVPFLSVCVSDWIVLGGTNRGSATTWPTILSFLQRNKHRRGAIIFVDELDKTEDDSNWNAFLRTEIFSLCDARIPLGINALDYDGDSEDSIEEAEHFLRNRVMIIGGSAFQEIWEERNAPSMGFLPEPACASQPELTDLVGVLPRELINRFSSEMFILPQLGEDDYRAMLDSITEQVPEVWRERFVQLGMSRVKQAVYHQKGVRFLEETLLSAVVAERSHLVDFSPDPPDPPDPPNEPEKEVEDEDIDIRIF